MSHSQAVKRVSFGEGTCITSSAARHLASLAASNISLTYITWRAVAHEGLHSIECFICPSLRTLVLHCSNESCADELARVIRKLAQACTGLVELHLSCAQPRTQVHSRERIIGSLRQHPPEMNALRSFHTKEFPAALEILPVLALSQSFSSRYSLTSMRTSVLCLNSTQILFRHCKKLPFRVVLACAPVSSLHFPPSASFISSSSTRTPKPIGSTAIRFAQTVRSVLAGSLLTIEITSWPFESEYLHPLFGCLHLITVTIPILFDYDRDRNGSLLIARAKQAWPNLERHDFSSLHTDFN
jgi:hypothetical protein